MKMLNAEPIIDNSALLQRSHLLPCSAVGHNETRITESGQ